MPPDRMFLGLCFLLLVPLAAQAQTPDAVPVNCTAPTTGFDGIQALKYATVTPGDPVALQGVNKSAKRGSQSVPAGSSVAVASECAQWSYIQYIGETSVSKGWVKSDRLAPRPTSLPLDDGPPGERPPRDFPLVGRVSAVLKKGRGVPVCEAYLQRLNQTLFYLPPYCGIPENDQVPGFARLSTKPFSSPSLNRVYGEVKNGIWAALQRDGPIANDTTELAHKALRIFDPKVDIDNDGHPDNLLMYIGEDEELSECGRSSVNFPYGPLEVPKPYLLKPDSSHVDNNATIALFGVEPTTMPYGDKTIPYYTPVGFSISVFEFRNTYYFTAFVGRMDPQPGFEAHERRWIVVYHRSKDRLDEVCHIDSVDHEWERRP